MEPHTVFYTSQPPWGVWYHLACVASGDSRVPAHLRHTHAPVCVCVCVCVLHMPEWQTCESELKMSRMGCQEEGCFHSPVPPFLYLAHWPVALVLSALRLWRTSRSHFRLPTFNGRPKGTLNMSFIKQRRGWCRGVHGKNNFKSEWAFLIPPSFPHTRTAAIAAAAISQQPRVTLMSAACFPSPHMSCRLQAVLSPSTVLKEEFTWKWKKMWSWFSRPHAIGNAGEVNSKTVKHHSPEPLKHKK